MARGDGVHRTSVRNVKIADSAIQNIQAHNERAKEVYSNSDIVLERTWMNIHFKQPNDSYKAIFDKLITDKIISVRGLKSDACKFGELIFDVNSLYFDERGGYDFAKQFYSDAYKAAIEIVGGEKFILSAVMHADERNRALSDALRKDVYHYHMHVVYIPVVQKEIRWSAHCKNHHLVGTIKESINQVSMRKKWASKPALDDKGKPLMSATGKIIYKKSYSVLQDQFFGHMRNAGYTDVCRGEIGSTQEHLTITQFKVEKEQERLNKLQKIYSEEKENFERAIEDIRQKKLDFERLDKIKATPTLIGNKVSMYKEDFDLLVTATKKHIIQEKKECALQNALDPTNKLIAELKNNVSDLKQRLLDAYKEICEMNAENDCLRKRVHTYDDVVSRNGLQPYFIQEKEKDMSWGEER